MSLIIDRFEGDYAICELEDGSFQRIERKELPLEAAEGDVLTAENNSYTIDSEAKISRKHQMEELLSQLFEEDSI